MLCPYCTEHFHLDYEVTDCVSVELGGVEHTFYASYCPACKGVSVQRVSVTHEEQYSRELADILLVPVAEEPELVYPKRASRPPLPPEVPEEHAEDYNEAVLVLTDSPKASAALSRRALQRLLREHLNIEKHNLYQEIQVLLETGDLPTYLVEAVDAVRNVGNFAVRHEYNIINCFSDTNP